MPLGLRIAPLLTSANINKEQIETHSLSEIPSWCIRKPTIDLSLHSEKKSESNPHLLKQNFHDRIGHTRLTHSCLLKREERPYCIGCDTPFTVRHFLLDCADFNRERYSLIRVNNLKDLFKDLSVENILSFLKNINLFNKI